MIKKMYFSCVLILFFAMLAKAQAPVIKWQNAAITDTPKIQKFVEDGYEWAETYGVIEHLLQLLPLADGNYIGLVQTYRSGYEYKLVKFNPNGDTISVKKLADYNLSIIANINQSMATTKDGGVVLLGSNESLPYPYPISVLKLDANGNKQWMETYTGGDASGADVNETPGSIITTADGGYLLTATSNRLAGNDKTESGKGGDDYWLVKINATGLVEWDKTFGGSGRDEASLIVQANDGGYLIAGNSQSPASGDKSAGQKGGVTNPITGMNYNVDFWVLRLDAGGNKIWDKTIGGTLNERLTVLSLTSDGGFLIGGNSESGIGGDKTSPQDGTYEADMWVLKCDAAGTLQWQQALGGNGFENLSAIYELADGGCMAGGHSTSGISGTKTVKGYDSGPYAGNADYWIIRLGADGNIVWQTAIGGSGGESLGAILPAADGGILLAGQSRSSISGVRTVAQKGLGDLWFVKLGEAELPVTLLSFTGYKVNGDAELVWATATEENFSRFELQKQDAPGHFATLATIPAKGNNSHYNYTDKLSEGINYYRLKMVDKDGIVEYSSIVTIKEDAALKISLQPNPVSNGTALVVKIPVAAQQSYMQVIAMDGKILSTKNIVAGSTTVRLNTDALAKGTYFLRYVSNSGQQLERFVKQ